MSGLSGSERFLSLLNDLASLSLVVAILLFSAFSKGVVFFPEDIPPTTVFVQVEAPTGTRVDVTDGMVRQIEGELGQRIYSNVSREGWQKWLERLTMIINENGLSTADVQSIELIEKHMVGFFFQEGDYGQVPAGFNAGGGGGKK